MDQTNSWLDVLARGGPMVWPLLAASLFALAAAVERFAVVRGALTCAEDLIEDVTRQLRAGGPDRARAVALGSHSPVARVMVAGLDAWDAPADTVERAMVEQAMVEREALHRRLPVLDTVTTVAPLLGLLGTVTGMIQAFQVVGSKNQIAAPTAITGGVAEALIATALGLGIAICSLLAYNYLSERVRQVVGLMEIAGTRLVNIKARECEAHGDGLHATHAVSA